MSAFRRSGTYQASTVTSARSIAASVSFAGGVVRQSVLVRTGWSKADIAAAVARGILTRIRRSWLALPNADPHLAAAARAGVVLTCVTQAQRLGLWVLNEDRPHVAAASHSGSVRVERDDVTDGGALRATVHWAKPLVARDPIQLVDPVENVLALVAQCQPFEAALTVWESALRQGVADRSALERLPLPAAARAVLAQASPYSDSGLETLVVPRDPRRLPTGGRRLACGAGDDHASGRTRTSPSSVDPAPGGRPDSLTRGDLPNRGDFRARRSSFRPCSSSRSAEGRSRIGSTTSIRPSPGSLRKNRVPPSLEPNGSGP